MDAFFRTIPGLLDAIDDSEEVRNAFVTAAWKRVAGRQITERTSPLGLKGRRLVIAVPEKTWQRNLESLAPQMLFRLNNILGHSMVDLIEFRIEPDAIKPRGENVSRIGADQTKDVPPEIAVSAARIRDEGLRRAVIHAAANCLSRAQKYPDPFTEKIDRNNGCQTSSKTRAS